jgi:hypothetical protein
MASSRPEVDVEIAEVPVYRGCPYGTHLRPLRPLLLTERLLRKARMRLHRPIGPRRRSIAALRCKSGELEPGRCERPIKEM